MLKNERRILGSALSGAILFSMIGCSAAPPPAAPAPPPPDPSANEPSFEVAGFGPMEEASLSRALPYLTTGGGIPREERCFARNKDTTIWDTQNPDVITSIQANVLPIKSGILHFLQNNLAAGKTDTGISKWQLDIDELTVRHLEGSKVLLKNKQSCFSSENMMLPGGSKVVTTLFGAKRLLVKSPTEINRALIKKMKKSGKKQNIYINTVLTYKKARDENGKPIFEKGKPLFKAPDGTLVKQKKVPPKGKRPVFELVIKTPGVLNFAYGYMPTSHWKMENQKGMCDINLVYDDLTPRVPECAALEKVGFGITEAKNLETDVVVKISGGGEVTQRTIPFGQRELISVGGHFLLWVQATKEELGATLAVDSITLNGDVAPKELEPFSFGR